MLDKTITNPGYHKQFLRSRFNEEQRKILDQLKEHWYLTSSGETIKIAQSSYEFFLMKPTPRTSEMFNLERELICVFSDYDNFETRALDAFDHAARRLTKLRAETVCCVLISRFPDVEAKVDGLLKSDPEHAIVVPFTYEELKGRDAGKVVEDRFRKHFYTRDLFSFLSPLKKDTYFFGRANLINDLVNRYKSGEHAGLFGLRKSGKTSIVYAIERRLEASGDGVISLDCESPGVHQLRWYELLQKIVVEYRRVKESKVKLDPTPYEEKGAADRYYEEMLRIHSSKRASSTLIILDEIERLTPGTASSIHWKEGSDFIYFWQTLRSFFQRHPNVFCYMLVGTNPNCVEAPIIAGQENPIYASLKAQYVPPFSVSQVKEMVARLGDYMGLKFDESIFTLLANDLGGHPFLIRQMCSLLNSKASKLRPAKVDRALYSSTKKEFAMVAADHLEMMIQVLRDHYADEHEMLRMLSCGEDSQFLALARDNASYTRHLIGYGLVEASENGYCLTLESLGDLMRRRHVYQRQNLTQTEKISEISERRNSLEKSLRQVIRMALRTTKGEKKGAELVLAAMEENRRKKFAGLSLSSLLDRDASPLFFLDLVNLISREWSSLENLFAIEKGRLVSALEDINKFGRPDAHAKTVTDDDFAQLRLHFKKIEQMLEGVL